MITLTLDELEIKHILTEYLVKKYPNMVCNDDFLNLKIIPTNFDGEAIEATLTLRGKEYDT